MAYLETFIGYDEDENQYSIVVHGNFTSDGKRMVKDYSLESTGEVLSVIEEDKIFLIQSKGIQLFDIRNF